MWRARRYPPEYLPTEFEKMALAAETDSGDGQALDLVQTRYGIRVVIGESRRGGDGFERLVREFGLV